MRTFSALSGMQSDVKADVKVMPVAYNPDGGPRVQLAWLRYSNSLRFSGPPDRAHSHRRTARPCVRPADPERPVRPAACR
ncbi:hypothetical protein GCM10017557_45160 [Streptomyces aurantiacus]|uniref:Uncharacterized protein n=1 Tax=Streptomyces aurantiacus TaxID=47760 RepID=A0A7G1P772_9ACTN|nr:hypothetical protein GCM10017557_45160 [Streptomyces aurantiacus]